MDDKTFWWFLGTIIAAVIAAFASIYSAFYSRRTDRKVKEMELKDRMLDRLHAVTGKVYKDFFNKRMKLYAELLKVKSHPNLDIDDSPEEIIFKIYSNYYFKIYPLVINNYLYLTDNLNEAFNKLNGLFKEIEFDDKFLDAHFEFADFESEFIAHFRLKQEMNFKSKVMEIKATCEEFKLQLKADASKIRGYINLEELKNNEQKSKSIFGKLFSKHS
jgi:hypothetical protein